MKKEFDINKSWLTSNSFIKRAFAIYGYCMAAAGMLYLAIIAAYIFILMLFYTLGLIFGL